ncbi:MAG: glucosamine-6-phosphate deaminase [Synergistaceae bacterium]|jgi:glucosamine-6-phosphate deaminase|nr:glucosamine-6-phosphate deaminase [Synergistaceae bacterium]
MRVYRAIDYNDMSRKAANIISAQIILQPDSVLGLATGSSPLGIYKQLIEWYKKGDLDFSEITSVNLDEYAGLSGDDVNSYRYFMKNNFWIHINIRPENTHIPYGAALDPESECIRYDSIISALGGIDMQLLGLGHNGHIGFNEPGAAFDKDTHLVALTKSTIEANRQFFGGIGVIPSRAYTMGIRSIMQSRKILVVANGAHKARIVKEAFFGPVTPMVPASVLQLHNNVTLVGDEGAMALI